MTTDLIRPGQGSRVVPVFPLAARTATPNVQQFNFDCNGLDRDGLIVLVNVTALTATGTLTVKIEGVDPNTGAAYTILTSAALAATGVVVLRVHPNLPASANVTAQDMVPPVFQVTATHGNGVSITYGITVLIGG